MAAALVAAFFVAAPAASQDYPLAVNPCITKHGAILIVLERNKGSYVEDYIAGELAHKFRSVYGPAEEVVVFGRRGDRTTVWAVHFRHGCAVAEQGLSMTVYWMLAGQGA